MKSKLILFDFDGTIGNTMPILLPSIDKTLKQHKQRSFYEIMAEYKDGTAFLYGFDHTLDKELVLNSKAQIKNDIVNNLHIEYAKCPLTLGVDEFIKVIYEKNIPMIVLTCNKEDIVRKYLSDKNLLHYFKEIIGSESLVNDKKDINTYNYILQKYNILAGECAMFEDSDRPLEQAQKAGLNGVLISKEKENGINIFKDFTEINAILNYI